MNKYLNDVVKEIKPSGIRRFFDLSLGATDAIPLSVGEPDFDTPKHIAQKGIEAIENGNTFYTPNAGLLELRKEISKFVKRKYDCDYNEEEILVTLGGSEAIDLSFRVLLNPGDEVIMTNPGYVSYEPNVKLVGGVPVFVDIKEKNNFKIDPEDLEKVITDKTKMLVMNYPNNPTGAIMEKEDLEKIAKIVIKHDLIVVSDEIYSELTYKGKHVSLASIEGMKDHVVLINGFSKSFAMTGWRLGYVCADKDIIKQMIKVHQYTAICVSTISQFAGIEALKNGDDDIEKMKEQYVIRRKYLLQRFKDMGLDCYVPYGAFYCFVNISKFGLSSEEFALRLVFEGKVIVIPGTAFGSKGEGFLRVSYAYSIEDLKEGMDRFERFIQTL